MLLWINGVFGSGKTLIAPELVRRLGAAEVCDPELLGFALHRMLPASARGDFQDLPQWRSGGSCPRFAMLRRPMTVS